MPGLVDAHAHIGTGSSEIAPRTNWVLANLAFGVTTMHDPSNGTEMIFSTAETTKAGEIVGPRIFSTGTILYGAEGSIKAITTSFDDALTHLRRMQAVGASSVKSCNKPRRDARQQIIEAARALEMMVVPEGGSTFSNNVSMACGRTRGCSTFSPGARSTRVRGAGQMAADDDYFFVDVAKSAKIVRGSRRHRLDWSARAAAWVGRTLGDMDAADGRDVESRRAARGDVERRAGAGARG